jgi:glutathione S-transferase
MQRKVPHSVGACFELIEQHMFKGPWVMGETYTICALSVHLGQMA